MRYWTVVNGVHLKTLQIAACVLGRGATFGCSQARDITIVMACNSWDWSIDRWVQDAYQGHDPNNLEGSILERLDLA